MATEYDDLVETLIFLITRRLESKREFTRGLLGDGLGNVDVPGREGYSYVRPDRSSNKILEIFNKRVFSADGTPVLIGEIPWQPGLSQCLDIDWDTYLTVGWPNRFAGIAQHGDTHVWRDGFIGEDPFSVYRRQIFDLRCEPIGSGTTSVIVTPYGLNDAGTLKTWPGSPGIDLAPAIPSATGTIRNALVYWDYSGETLYGTLGVATGTLDTVTETSIPPKPVEPIGSIPSAYVQLQGGQAQITETDIKDARPLFSTPTPGNDSIKVSKVWRSNFGSVALQADANGNIGIGDAAPDSQLVVNTDMFIGPAAASGDTDNAFLQIGLTINQENFSDEALTFKSSFVDQGMTSVTETDTYGSIFLETIAAGGVVLAGFTETDLGVRIDGSVTNDTTTKATSSEGAVVVRGRKKSGTAISSMGADANLLVIRNNSTSRWILDAEGTAHHIPSSDTDIDLITVQVTGDPTFSWDESQDQFDFSKGANFAGDVGITGGAQSYLFTDRSTALSLQSQTSGVAGILDLFTKDGDGTDNTEFNIFGKGTPSSITNRERLQIRYRNTNTFEINTEADGTGTLRPLILFTEGNSNQLYLNTDGNVGIGTTSPSAKLHVDQASTTAAIPVLYLDQADISEEMIEFNTTIGVGNAIEAVGAKTLTVTHFIKCTLPGGLTRYWPVGTIA
jgi:hypothetical protein